MRNPKLTATPQKILIVKPSSLGDVVHSLAFLNAVREQFPDAEIHWVVARGLEGLLTGHPMIKKIWVINKDMWKKLSQISSSFSEIQSLLRNLRKEHYDIVVDLQGLLRSGIITMATGAPVRIGFMEAREGSRFFYTHRVKGGKDIHAVDRYLKIASFLGCDITDVRFPLPLKVTSSPLPHHHSTDKAYAIMVPGARWRTKRWPPEYFGELTSLLPIKTVIVGSRADVDIANRIVALSNGRALSLAGNTEISELVEIMRGARFVVSNDSGPMHIAAALGIPVFAIFGPTDPMRTRPYGEGHTIIREDISCIPCFKRKCGDLKCMENLSVEKVYREIKSKLKLPP